MVGATSGDEALLRVAQHDFDVVLLDVNMPSPNGWQTLPGLLDGRPDLKVLMTSGLASEQELRERGAVGLLDKPFSSQALLRAIDATLDAMVKRR